MYRTLIRFAIVLAVLGLLAPTASAGGMATVHLDAPPENVVMGVPYRLGFMVMQHDVTPANVDRAVVSATHRETGEALEAIATQEGPVGHYVVDLTFPKAGSWKWMITPEPFDSTSFESLMVLESAAVGKDHSDTAASHPAHIHDGSCQTLGDVQFPLSDVVPDGAIQDGTLDTTSGKVGTDASVSVAISTTTLDVTIAELLASPHAINIHKSANDISTLRRLRRHRRPHVERRVDHRRAAVEYIGRCRHRRPARRKRADCGFGLHGGGREHGYRAGT